MPGTADVKHKKKTKRKKKKCKPAKLEIGLPASSSQEYLPPSKKERGKKPGTYTASTRTLKKKDSFRHSVSVVPTSHNSPAVHTDDTIKRKKKKDARLRDEVKAKASAPLAEDNQASERTKKTQARKRTSSNPFKKMSSIRAGRKNDKSVPLKARRVSSPKTSIHKLHVSSALEWDEAEDITAESFRLITELGRGGFGRVYKMRHTLSGSMIAVKVVELPKNHKKAQSLTERLEREVKYLKACKHQNIVSYFGCMNRTRLGEEQEKETWVLMELCTFGSVKDIMHTLKRRLNENEIRQVLLGLLKGLEYLHSTKVGILHQDIKARNVLVDGEGVIKLGDFGSAGVVEQGAEELCVIGTPSFLSPEVCQGIAPSTKSDIWAVGITGIELAEGHAPLHQCSSGEAVSLIASGRARTTLREPRRWSTHFRLFLESCLDPDPSNRLSATELLGHPFVATEDSKGLAALLPELLQVLDRPSKVLSASGTAEKKQLLTTRKTLSTSASSVPSDAPQRTESPSLNVPGTNSLSTDTILLEGVTERSIPDAPPTKYHQGPLAIGPAQQASDGAFAHWRKKEQKEQEEQEEEKREAHRRPDPPGSGLSVHKDQMGKLRAENQRTKAALASLEAQLEEIRQSAEKQHQMMLAKLSIEKAARIALEKKVAKLEAAQNQKRLLTGQSASLIVPPVSTVLPLSNVPRRQENTENEDDSAELNQLLSSLADVSAELAKG